MEAARDDPTTLQWFKLLLVNDKDLPGSVASCDYLERARAALKVAKKTAQEVVRDYLALLWEHIVDSITKAQRKSIVDQFRFRVVLTVPATWADEPRIVGILEQAATQAGIKAHRDCGQTTLNFAAEPEAAAFSEMKDSEHQNSFQVYRMYF